MSDADLVARLREEGGWIGKQGASAIDRLTRELAEARKTTAGYYDEAKAALAECDRYKAALESIQRQLIGYREFSPADELRLIASRALAGEPVQQKNWKCPRCGNMNDGSNEVCWTRCGQERAGAGDDPLDPTEGFDR